MVAHDCRGFSMLEALIAVSLMLAAFAAAFSMAAPGHSLAAASLEATDVHQRARVAVDALRRDLAAAGTGPGSGPLSGPLTRAVPPVHPNRRGARNADPPGTVRSDAITTWAVPAGPGGTTLAVAAAAQALQLRVLAQPLCPVAQPLCEFADGGTVLVADQAGTHELLTVTKVSAATLTLQHSGQPLSAAFAAGAAVVPLESHTYFTKFDASTGALQLMSYDGSYSSDAPVLDHLVSLAFEYDAEPSPPGLRRADGVASSLRTTYGPPPPSAGTSIGSFPAGENCLFRIDPANGQPIPRLPALGAPAGPLVRMPMQAMADGPWCPDEAAASRVDADLLRIRRVTVLARVQAATAALRGAASQWFANAGTAQGARRVPDFEARLTVVLRNPGLWR